MKLHRNNAMWDREERKKTNENWDRLEKLGGEVDDLVLESGGDSNLEVVQARGGERVLNDRLNKIDREINDNYSDVTSQLAEMATKEELNIVDDNKADKGALAQVAQSKRDKDVEIEMKDLSQEVKEAMTGGSVAVVGEDAVGNINLKDNAVESRNIHKNARIKFPYFSDDSYDLNYFWDEKTVIASGDVKNNPFGTGCQVINFRSKTLESVGAVRLTQIAIVYGSGTNFDFGEGLYRHLLVNESTHELTRVSDWRKLGIDKVTNDLLDDDFMVSGYLEDDTFDLDYTVKEGNYFVNRNALNNPYRRSSVLKVSRYKLENTPIVRVVQGVMCTDIGFSGGKYAGRIATRTLNFNEETNEVLHKTDWTDGRDEVIEILLISNSFGLNSTEYIHRICESLGLNVVVGCLYISGGLLSDHKNNIDNNSKVYSFYRRYYNEGTLVENNTSGYSIEDGINERDWDYVVINQASAQSGVYDSFQPYLDDIIDYVKSEMPDIKIALMPTWAYASDFDDARFDKYDRDQLTMYNAIMSTYKQAMGDVDFDIIIPVGTAIQNARTDDYLMSIDRELTRDGFHLGDTGMYLASLTFFKSFFGNLKIDWKPSSVDNKSAYLASVAVDNAVLNPFKITNI